MTCTRSHACDDAEIVRDQDERRPSVGDQLAEEVEDLGLDRDVERSGSSAISSFGSQASAMAIMTRCRMPPENWWG